MLQLEWKQMSTILKLLILTRQGQEQMLQYRHKKKNGTNIALPLSRRNNCHYCKGESTKRGREKASVLLKMSAVKTASSVLHLLILALTIALNNNSKETYHLNTMLVCHC